MGILGIPVLVGLLLPTPVPVAPSTRFVDAPRSGPIMAALRRPFVQSAFGPHDTTTHGRVQPDTRNWVKRHPALCGALIGFVTGFLIGYLPGDDAVFDDFVAAFNGFVLGGVGAGGGAIIGWAIGRK